MSETIVHNDVPLRFIAPSGEPRAGVIVLHQAPGFTPQIEGWLERLAGEGYLAVAPLLHHRTGSEFLNPADFGGDLSAFAAALPGDNDAVNDIGAALDYLAEQGLEASHAGILGFSYGGRLTYLVASQRPLAAAVSYYSGGIQRKNFHGNDAIPALTERTAGLQTPWLGFIGEQDFMLEPGELDAWEAALESAPVPVELVRYPGAGHAFDVDMPFGPGMPSPYVAEAADDAERRALEFLTARLG